MVIVAIGILVGVNISNKSTLKAGIVLSLLNCLAVCCSLDSIQHMKTKDLKATLRGYVEDHFSPFIVDENNCL